MRKLCEEFRHFRGQPIEIITDRMKFIGIDVESDEDGVVIIDDCGRIVRLENRHINAVIELQMRLHRLCSRHDGCCDEDCDDCRRCGCDDRHHHDHDDKCHNDHDGF